jgi:hypothetical protein
MKGKIVNIIFEDVSFNQLQNAIGLANEDQKKTIKMIVNAENLPINEVGAILRVVDDNDCGFTVGRVNLHLSTFTRYRIELSNGREREMIARLAFALADER